MQVHRPLQDVVQHRGQRHLAHGDVLAGGAVRLVVDDPRGLEHQQPELLQLDGRVGDEALHELVLGQRLALRAAGQRPLAHHVEGALALADHPHGVVHPAAAKPGLCDLEAFARRPEHRVERHPDLVVADVALGALIQVVALVHGRDVADDLHPGRLGRDDEHRHPLVRPGVGVGHHHHDEERGIAGVGREPLLALDHPLVTVPGGFAHELLGIGARLRLGHREGGHDIALEQRVEVARLLLLGAVQGEDLGVAGVGGGGAENSRRPGRAAEDLVHQRQLQLTVALAAQFGAEVTGPQSLLLHLLPQRCQDRPRRLVVHVIRVTRAREEQVKGLALVAHERGHPVELLLELRLGEELPHVPLLPRSPLNSLLNNRRHMFRWPGEGPSAGRVRPPAAVPGPGLASGAVAGYRRSSGVNCITKY